MYMYREIPYTWTIPYTPGLNSRRAAAARGSPRFEM